MSSYAQFLDAKSFAQINVGFDPSGIWMPEEMKDFQSDIVRWAIQRGRAAIFADTGLGKTLMELSWGNAIAIKLGGNVLIAAPLCVAQQTVREASKFGINAKYVRHQDQMTGECQIYVTNYEMLKNFDPLRFVGIALDESSILKGMNGSLRKSITDFASVINYRLSCTATPSPNDFMEIGTQAEFLGIMSQVEMLATFFIHDGEDTSKWRLKGHGRRKFWEWLATWSVVIRMPSDLGYADEGYDLPPLNIYEHIVETEASDQLFVTVAQSLGDRQKARRDSVTARCAKAVELIAQSECCIAWTNLNDESEYIATHSGCEEITGSQDPDTKEQLILGFTNGDIKKIVTKPKIAGFGLNWQHCNEMVFVGLSDSFEALYQAIRRCWRFGQLRPVTVHIVISDKEGSVLENIRRKQSQHDQMGEEMRRVMAAMTIKQIKGASVQKNDYLPKSKISIPIFLGARA